MYELWVKQLKLISPRNGLLLCNFNGYERNMHQRHLTAEHSELTARTSLAWPTGVNNRGSHTYTFRALNGRSFWVSFFEGKLRSVVWWNLGLCCERQVSYECLHRNLNHVMYVIIRMLRSFRGISWLTFLLVVKCI